MIGYWHHHAVRLSVCLSVTLCIVAIRVGVWGKMLYRRVPSRHVPICPFIDTCCIKYCLATATKRTEKNSRRKRDCKFLRKLGVH